MKHGRNRAMFFNKNYQDPKLNAGLLARLRNEMESLGRPVRFMEVCGTHTVSIFRSGLRSLLPDSMEHLSGPGCPVCVTHDSEVAAFLSLAEKDVIIATFGDLLRVPAPGGRNLKNAKSEGADVRIVYSPMDAVNIAADNPGRDVVFLAVGFETTAPGVAGAIMSAKKRGLSNFTVLSCHKLVPPALETLLSGNNSIDAFLLPGHVAVITGTAPFEFVPEKWKKPAVIGGFEPAEIVYALIKIVEQIKSGPGLVVNAYGHVVPADGNPSARKIMDTVFEPRDAKWRGLGMIPGSGLGIREEFESADAAKRYGIVFADTKPIPGCRCGDVLSGKMTPAGCPLFGKVCTPRTPTGPCMVSTEGSCAAWYNYGAGE